MERGQLQREWALHRLDGRTSYATTVGSHKTVDRELEALPGAGCASRVVAPAAAVAAAAAAAPPRGSNQDEARADGVLPGDVDWAGNLVRVNRRKTFRDDLRQRGNVRVEDGFLVAQQDQGIPRRRASTLQNDPRESSQGVWQSSPGGLEPSQWRTSYQDGLCGTGRSSGSASSGPGRPGALTPTTAFSRSNPLAQQPQQVAMQPRAKPTYDKEKGDFVRGLDTHSIAKSLKRQGLRPTQPPMSGSSSSESKSAGNDVLILENFKHHIPGTTLYTTHRPR